MKYKQVLIDDVEETCWLLSVPEDVETTDRGRVVDPTGAIAEGSVIIAVEQGIGPAGVITVLPNPFDEEEADAAIKQGGGNGHKPQPETYTNPAPRCGAFTVSHTDKGIVLTDRPSLGDFLA
jgi:hypothetical protein